MTEKIKQLFATILQVDPSEIHSKSTPETIEKWDSLNHLNLIATFEEEFSIEIEPEEILPMMESFEKFQSIILQKIDSL